MTNKEVIQLFAKYEPKLIMECFDDCYCLGCNDGLDPRYAEEDFEEHVPEFTDDWLNQEYDKGLFREQDVERLIQKRNNDDSLRDKPKEVFLEDESTRNNDTASLINLTPIKSKCFGDRKRKTFFN